MNYLNKEQQESLLEAVISIAKSLAVISMGIALLGFIAVTKSCSEVVADKQEVETP